MERGEDHDQGKRAKKYNLNQQKLQEKYDNEILDILFLYVVSNFMCLFCNFL